MIFVTGNSAPSVSLVSPANGTTDVGSSVTLRWKGTDPDGDSLTYDLYFGTDATPTLRESGLNSESFDVSGLTGHTTYYWKVVVKDGKGKSSSSDVWNFVTGDSTPSVSNGDIKWKYETDNQIYSSPAIGSDGTVYVGSYDDYLYAIYTDEGV